MPKGRPMLTAYRCLRPVKVVFFCLSLTAVTQCCSHAAAIHNLQRVQRRNIPLCVRCTHVTTAS